MGSLAAHVRTRAQTGVRKRIQRDARRRDDDLRAAVLRDEARPRFGECPRLVATARRAELRRAAALLRDDLPRPEPERAPPPLCLLTVAQARAAASLLPTPFFS
jgi:hypothetical protein